VALLPETVDTSVRVLGAEDHLAAQSLWLELERQVVDPGLTCSWDWTEAWLDQFGDIVPHEFVVVATRGTPSGIVLLTHGVGRTRGRIPLRTLEVGTAGEPTADSIYVMNNRLLVVPQTRTAAVRAILAEIHRDTSWDELRLHGFVPDDAAEFLAADSNLVPRWEPCPTVDLREADRRGGNVLSILTANTRYQIRRSIRAFGEAEGEWAESVDQALDILDELVRLHQKRWRAVGSPGAFASERFLEFHRALVKRVFDKGAVLLYRVCCRHGTIGCLYSFIERNNVLSYQLGLPRFDDNKLKPGFVSHALCMQSAYERGLDDYNFLADASPWKREIATTERYLVWATGARSRLKLTLAGALQATARKVRQR
jgi:CelD/BcsL family acetyltransferase involved in cellulose biosynthesis